MRLFAALPIPDEVARQITRIQTGLKGAKWSPRDNLHVTLRFVGACDVHQARALDDALGQIRVAPFELTLQGVNHFDHDHPYAMWLSVVGVAALLQLQKACERACRKVGFAPDVRSYTPHVTICYLPARQALDTVMAFEQDHNLFKTDPFQADRFYLYNSIEARNSPSRYEIVAEYPLVA